MLRLQGWRPINWPGDRQPAGGPRPRVDWLVLAAMVVDAALFASYVVPWLQSRPGPRSTGKLIAFLVMVAMVWLGPFLGLLLRRGRGAALLSYAVVKLSIVLALLGSWWGHRLAESGIALASLATPICWHLFGVVASLIALVTSRRASRAADAVIRAASPTAVGPG